MNYSKKLQIILLILLSFALITDCGRATHEAADSLATSMADSEMKRNPEAWMIDFQSQPKWSYVNGLVCLAILKVWEQTGNDKYFQYAKGYADSLIDQYGEIKGYKKEDFNLDKLNSGKILFILYKETGDNRYKIAIETLRDQIQDQPRVPEGGFWHKQIYTNQMWLDGIYMGAPFYAEYAETYGDTSAFNDIALQFTLMEEHAHDSISGWYYHGWDASKSIFWADSVTGLSKNFWGRGVGWYYMALVDVLDFFPADHPKRNTLMDIYLDLSKTIIDHQDQETGLWYQVLDMPEQEGNYLEATCSAMFAYGLIKGLDKGYLDQSYLAPTRKGYQGIVNQFIRKNNDGTIELTNCCAGAGLGPEDNLVRDGTFEYYINEKIRSNDGKGTGPFIMASLTYENSPIFKNNE